MKHKKHFFTIFLGLIFSLLFFTSSNAQPVFPATLSINTQNSVNYWGNFFDTYGYTIIGGDLVIQNSSDITDLTPLDIITSVQGTLKIYDNAVLTNLDGLENVTSVGGEIYILLNDLLTNLNGLGSITSVGTNILIQVNAKLTNINGLGSITSLNGNIGVSGNPTLTNVDGLESLTSVGGNIAITNNTVLTNLDGLGSITSVGGTIEINNPALTDLDGLESLTSIGGKLIIQSNALTNLDGLGNLQSVGGDIDISANFALTNLDGLGSLTSVDGEDIHFVNNTVLVSFCGLYPLLDAQETIYVDIRNNGANPTGAEILAAGPCTPSVTVVAVDIKPETCPNSFNVKKNGDISVAILGTDDFDVQNIDPETLLLEGISPLRWDTEDIATPISNGEQCDCTIEGPDGFDDLTTKFDSQELVAALGEINDGDELVLTITGDMLDGTPFEGSDCVVIIAKGFHKDLTVNLNDVPEKYTLFGNYPNPFNPSTIIKFAEPEESFIKLEVYNTLGERVNTLVAETLTAGIYSVDWNGSYLSSGIYIYRLQAGSFVETKKMILMK